MSDLYPRTQDSALPLAATWLLTHSLAIAAHAIAVAIRVCLPQLLQSCDFEFLSQTPHDNLNSEQLGRRDVCKSNTHIHIHTHTHAEMDVCLLKYISPLSFATVVRQSSS